MKTRWVSADRMLAGTVFRVIGVAALACTALATSASAQTAPTQTWSGWARCQIDVQGPGYTHQEIHTWTLAGGAPTIEGAFRVYAGTWSVVGGGSLQRTQGAQSLVAQWATNVAAVSAPLAVFVRASDGRMFIQARHAQLRSQGSVAGYQQIIDDTGPKPPGQLSSEAFEWAFPVVDGLATATALSGSSTPAVNGSVGLMQPGGSRGTASCTWQFGQGTNAPAPPPTVQARAVPTGPSPGGGLAQAPPVPATVTPTVVQLPPAIPTVAAPGGAPTPAVVQLPPATPTATPTVTALPPTLPSVMPTATSLPPALPTTLPVASPLPPGIPQMMVVRGKQAFTANGEFTVPEGITQLLIEAWGAGGGGGTGVPTTMRSTTCSSPSYCRAGVGGRGGGSGAYTRTMLTVTSGLRLVVLVGTAGKPGLYYPSQPATDGSATEVRSGFSVVAVAAGGKSGSNGGTGGQAGSGSTLVVFPGVDGAAGSGPPPFTGSSQSGGVGGAGGAAVVELASPVGTNGGSGGRGGAFRCSSRTPAGDPSACDDSPPSAGSSGAGGHVLITW